VNRRLSKESNTKTASVEERAPYKPPTGFEPSSCDENAKASKLFKEADLEGKQIWYFTAPGSVPISSIQHMSLQDAKDGKKIFSHNGKDYGFVQDVAEDKTYTKIMVPSSKDGYRAGKHPSRLIVTSVIADQYTVLKTIDQTLHLQQIVKLPGVHGPESSSFAKATVPTKKPVREQPPGLKMRFQPIGFGSRNLGKIESSSSSADAASTESESDAEMTEAPAGFRRPASTEPEDSDSDENDSSESSESGDSSSSDREMTEAPRLLAKPVVTPRAEKPSTKHISNDGSPSSSLKRKHSEGLEKKAKNSSSQSTPANDDRQLKRLKTKQTISQTSLADIQSASTKAHKTTASTFGSKSSSSLSKPAAILPQSSRTILPASSPAAPRASQSTLGNKNSELKPSSEKPTSKKRDRDTPVKSSRDEPSRREITKATDPRLPPGERREKIKKLKKQRKHEDAGRHSHSSRI